MKLAYRYFSGVLAVVLVMLTALSPRPALAGFASAPVSEDIPELLAPAGVNDTASTAAARGPARRARNAQARPALLDETQAALAHGQTPAPLALTLFPDQRVVARFERVDTALDQISTLVGKLDDYPFGEIHLSRSGDAFFASINTGSAAYEVSSTDGQSVLITEIDSASLPPEEDLIPPDRPAADAAPAPSAPADTLVVSSSIDDGSRIDVYVGYTSAARAAAGGTLNMQARIATAISETNTGYANSGINQRVTLVGSGEYNYGELSGTTGWNAMLDDWSNPTNAVFGPAHTARNNLKADEMVLIIDDGTYCGLGYLMTSGWISTSFAPSAFALVSLDCATGYYSFAHEMGHNMGAHHDKISAGSGVGAYPYSYGFWITNPATNRYDYRTIMAYNTYPTYPYNAQRLNYWSNPNVTLPQTGTATGSATANNALTLNNTASVVAQFRDGAVPYAPTGLTATAQGNSILLQWSFSSSDVLRFRVERSEAGVGIWSEIGQTGPSVLSYTDATISLNKSYIYRVLADNGNGRTVSNEANTLTAPSNALASLVTGTASQYRLTWTDNSTGETGFQVERTPANSTSWSLVGTVASSPWVNDPGTGEFLYRVRAVGSGSIYSFYSNTAPTLPNAPTSLTGSAVNQARVRLNWTDNSLVEAGFPVEVSWLTPDSWVPWVTAPASAVAAVSYEVTDLVCYTTYKFRIRAKNDAGTSAAISTSVGILTPTCEAPSWLSDPAHGTATATAVGSFALRLSWPNVDGETGYRLQRLEQGVPTTTWNLGANVTTYTVTGLRPFTTYAFQVIAVNSRVAAPGASDSAPIQFSGTTNPAIFLPKITK